MQTEYKQNKFQQAAISPPLERCFEQGNRKEKVPAKYNDKVDPLTFSLYY